MPSQRLGRAATFAFGAAIATTAMGCGTATPGTDGGTQPGDAFVAVADAGTDSGLSAAYGGPPIDAGTDGGLSAAYGAPPDAFFEDTGTSALYGSPPPPPAPETP